MRPQAKEVTAEQAAVVLGMLKRRDRQVDIALVLRMSPSTVNRIKKRRIRALVHVVAAPVEALPPPGPYVVVSQHVHDAALIAEAANAQIVSHLRELANALELSRSGNTDQPASGLYTNFGRLVHKKKVYNRFSNKGER